ncbi:MAG TPA: (deoxy)nucleoside triphosphate pyrophosphohydrolase [Nocardioides sp.]|nr:(deoxy)nucleoside triphosphate pyrophosphohydrolase [Nocardioides sp.]
MEKRQIEVVGAVIVEDGKILCAQRGTGALAGMWEFPGGKLEPGETHHDALVREIAEEIHCEIAIGSLVTTTRHEYDAGVLTLTTYYCTLVAGSPVLTEHSELAWLAPADLDRLDWAPADLPAVEVVRRDLG